MQEVAVSRARIHDALHPRTVECGSAVFDQPLLCERSHDRIDTGVSPVFSLLRQGEDRVSRSLLYSENLWNSTRLPGDIGDRELLANSIGEIRQVKHPRRMASCGAPDRSGVSHVGTK